MTIRSFILLASISFLFVNAAVADILCEREQFKSPKGECPERIVTPVYISGSNSPNGDGEITSVSQIFYLTEKSLRVITNNGVKTKKLTCTYITMGYNDSLNGQPPGPAQVACNEI
jgi:hypothetical protein